MDTKKQLYVSIVAIMCVIIVGSSGYYVMYGGEQKYLDCLFMTVISLTGVGYGEIVPVTGNPPVQIFTMFLITFGMATLLYGISALTALIIEGEVSGILKSKKMENVIKKLNKHYIVCGGGETGRPLVTELMVCKQKVVLIEQDEHKIDICKEANPGVLYVKGDATEEASLIAAGIDKALGVVICLPFDKDNLYITMTARMLNKDLRIISKITEPRHEQKLRKAGADSIVSPNMIGALRMASEMLRPVAVDFLDNMLRSKRGNLRIHQINISEDSVLIGKKIMESGIRDKFSLLILGAKELNGETVFNPSPNYILQEGMALVVMGEIDNIEKARKVF